MTSIQERLQRKREPLDKWSTREQLCLAFAVARSGDQNWMSVSRALKPFGDSNRTPDWFHQKNCAAQYGALLENVETPKRKKRVSGVESVIETPSESILRRLIAERKVELKKAMEEERIEFLRLQEEMELLKSGNVSEEQLDLMCKQIDEEEAQKEKEAIAHAQWLKERELRKQEIERAWRPTVKVNSPVPVPIGQKRKVSDSVDSLMDMDLEGRVTPTQQPVENKPALSPLLTSLLKSPSHAQNVVTSSILHTAITSQRPINSNTNPTIASLLNSSANVQVSAGLQQLVTSAITQEPIKDTIADFLKVSDPLPNLKMEDIESTILSSNEPLPEIKNEEVDIIISDLIENADIVTDPEQHLLEGNNDIIADFENELEELVNKEKEVEEAANAEAAKQEQKPKEIDPFEFQEEPEIFEPKLTPVKQVQPIVEEEEVQVIKVEKEIVELEVVENPKPEIKTPEPEIGSVEIVEVVEMEEEEIGKELNKSQIQDIVHKPEEIVEEAEEEEEEEIKETEEEVIKTSESEAEASPIVEIKPEVISETESIDIDIKQENETKQEVIESEEDVSRRNTFTPEYSENIFDDMNIEVTKLNKSGIAKRDYSRTKKKEGSDFDIILAVEQAVNTGTEEELSDSDKKPEIKIKVKVENDRSNSPWLEEEEGVTLRSRKNYSTPATPIDSVPNSPASTSAYLDDDRDYKNWKKSIMLVYSRLSTHKYASLFLKPISDERAPGYHNIVKRPMDLSTIRKNIENGNIRTTEEFQRDVLLMFQNAVMYNKTGETVYKMALEMQKEGVLQFSILLQAQNELVPLRRETRTSDLPGNKRKRGLEESSKNKKRKED